MNIRSIKTIPALLALCFQLIAIPASAADTYEALTEQSIQALMDASQDAATRGDTSRLASYLADDFVFSHTAVGPNGLHTTRLKRDEYVAAMEKSFGQISNYRTERDGVKISIAADKKSATVSLRTISSWTVGANDVRVESANAGKVELRNGKALFASQNVDVLERKSTPSAPSAQDSGSDVPFSDSDFAAYSGEGPATLEGEAFVRTRGGELRYCAGETVLLAPATQYDLSVIKSFGFGRDVAMKRAGPAAKYWQEAVCDSQGKFSFENLPFGIWVVITDVRYSVSGASQGGLMAKLISVRSKKTKIIMNEQTLRSNSFFGVDWPK